jgi:hypothetical protein
MGYIITKSDNETLILLNDGQVDNAVSSLTLVGKNVSGFGDAQNENFVRLLENFANSSANLSGSGQPRSPLRGQLWFDTNPNVNRPLVYDGVSWRPLAVTIVGTTTTNTLINATANPPIPFAANRLGDFFFNTTNNKLYVVSSTNTALTLIGPEAVSGFEDTRMSSTTMFDSSNNPKPVIQMIVDGEVVAIVSSSTFQVSNTTPVTGFTRVYRGVTFKNYNSSTRYTTATTDVVLHGLHEQLDASYPRRNVNESITADWNIASGKSLYFGSGSNSLVYWNTATSALVVAATSGNVSLTVGANSLSFNGSALLPSSSYNLGSGDNKFATLYSTTLSAGNSTATGFLEGDWTLSASSQFKPNSDISNNLGTSTERFNTVFARTLNAGSAATSGFITGVWNLNADSTIVPISNLANNLGQSSRRFNTVFASTISGLTSIVGSASVAGNITPAADATHSLGALGLRWNDVFANNLQATSAFIETLQIGNSSILSSAVTTGTFSNLQATSGDITNLTSNSSTFISLVATNGTISILNSPAATLGTANITNGTVATLASTNATISNLNSLIASFSTATITRGTVTNLQATTATINTIDGAVIRENGNRVISSFSTGTTGLTNSSANPGQVVLSGVLAVKNGGTGNTTFNAGYVKANGASAFTTVSSIPWSDIAGSPATSMPSGSVILFAMASPPAGWTKVTDSSYNDRALRVVTGTGAGLSGSVNFTSAFTNQSVNGSVISTVTNVSLIITNFEDIENEQNQFRVYRYAISDPGHAHEFVGTSIDLSVKYLDLIIASKD